MQTELEQLFTDRGNSMSVTAGFNSMMKPKNVEDRLNALIRLIAHMNVIKALIDKKRPVLQMLRSFVNMKIENGILGSEIKPACKAGCSACCHQVVTATQDEINEIVELVPTHLHERLAKQAVDIVTHPGAKRTGYALRLGKVDSACVFLGLKGECTIYEKRPLACRLVLARRAEECDPFVETDKSKNTLGVFDAEVAVSAYINVVGVREMQVQLMEKVQ